MVIKSKSDSSKIRFNGINKTRSKCSLPLFVENKSVLF